MLLTWLNKKILFDPKKKGKAVNIALYVYAAYIGIYEGNANRFA